MEPHEITPHEGPHTGTRPPHSLSSFVFIDLREDPEAWTHIENELPDDDCFTRH